MGKWALVTGASGGIGRAIAKSLSNEGYHLYLHYNKNVQSIIELKKELKTESVAVGADLSKENGVNQLLSQIEHDIDCLIYNSGDHFSGLITDINDEKVYSMTQLHSISPFLLVKRILPAMVQKKQGSIIFITSIWGQTGASCEVLYSMLKGGQNTLVKALAKEVGLSGIRVNGVAPGVIQTKMLEGLSESEISDITEDIPVGRLGQPEEVASAVVFLLSTASSYINGHILSVNGAWYT